MADRKCSKCGRLSFWAICDKCHRAAQAKAKQDQDQDQGRKDQDQDCERYRRFHSIGR